MAPRRRSPPRKPRKVLCFDVETESFTENSSEFIDDDPDEMSEGQLAEYMAGTFWYRRRSCVGHQFDWEI